MTDVSRDPREHWLKTRFSKNEVAKSGYSINRRRAPKTRRAAGESEVAFDGAIPTWGGWRLWRWRREKLRSLDETDEFGAIALEVFALPDFATSLTLRGIAREIGRAHV